MKKLVLAMFFMLSPTFAYAIFCGDGVVNQASEECDDGNTVGGDGCSSICTIETPEPDPFCGDGKINQPDEECDDGNNDNGDGCSAICLKEVEKEGCTPGYWKQSHHFDSWPLPYTPDTPFGSVFEDAFPGKTLLEVLWTGGGKEYGLGRHTVAALLNAASGGVSYPISEQGVIDMFNDTYPGTRYEYNQKKNAFEVANEAGCPLN